VNSRSSELRLNLNHNNSLARDGAILQSPGAPGGPQQKCHRLSPMRNVTFLAGGAASQSAAPAPPSLPGSRQLAIPTLCGSFLPPPARMGASGPPHRVAPPSSSVQSDWNNEEEPLGHARVAWIKRFCRHVRCGRHRRGPSAGEGKPLFASDHRLRRVRSKVVAASVALGLTQSGPPPLPSSP